MKNLFRLAALGTLILPVLVWANAGLQYPPFSPNGALTLYVSTTGNDTIIGIGNNSCFDLTCPCLTLQRAADSVASDTLIRGQTITVSLADGTYTTGFRTDYSTVFTLQGNCVNPTNVVLADASTNAAAIITTNNAAVKVRCMKISSTNGSLLFPSTHGQIQTLDNMTFGAAAKGQLHAESGGEILVLNGYTISGNAPAHFQAVLGGNIEVTDTASLTITLSGTPTFSTAFADIESTSVLYVPNGLTSFSGSATGSRYSVKGNAVIETNGGSATFLPGNAAGTTSNGGVYE